MDKIFQASKYSHCRYNPFNDSWVLVSPNRTLRPWHGEELKSDQKEETGKNKQISDDSEHHNYLGPNAIRANGQCNPDYKSTFAFDNDFSALCQNTPEYVSNPDDVFGVIKSAQGLCKVVCFHPDPSVTWDTMKLTEAIEALKAIKHEYKSMAVTGKYRWIQIFENKGSTMGCSNPHPHCQIWASNFLPEIPSKMGPHVVRYYESHSSSMFKDYVKWEQQKQERIVCENKGWICVVPFWAIWPFETMILQKSRDTANEISDLNNEQIADLAVIIQQIVRKYDKLFNCKFPYSMGLQGAPCLEKIKQAWDVHLIFLPPLLRSATVRKYMVGYELFAQPQRDITPEMAATKLRLL